jgi:hypothetical protein
MPKQIRLNAFDINCVGHQSPGLWTHPPDRADRYNTLEYWVELAKPLEDYRSYVSEEGALALMSGWTGVDFSKCGFDEPIHYSRQDAQTSALEAFTIADPNRKWTVREIAKHAAIGGRGPVVVGSPGEVADEVIAWVEVTRRGRVQPRLRGDAGNLRSFHRSGRARTAKARALQTGLRARRAAGEALRPRSRAARRGSYGGEVPPGWRSARQPMRGRQEPGVKPGSVE